MGGSANIRESNRLSIQRAIKSTNCPIFSGVPHGVTKHASRRQTGRAATVDFSFSPGAITDMVQKKRAEVTNAGGGLKSIIFSVGKVKFEVIAAMKGKKVIRIITIMNLSEPEANQNN